MTVYLKNNEGTTIGTNSDGASLSVETVTFSFDEDGLYRSNLFY